MTMAEHTPGPWRVEVRLDEFVVNVWIGDGCLVQLSIDNLDVAAPERVLANAELIASAPELLEVCKIILDDATGSQDQPGKRLWPLRAENYRKLHAAISKAEGKQKGETR